MNKKYDLIIIGGGPAGYEAAFEAVKNNLSVAIIEKNKIGGTCLNYGCVPTKSILRNVFNGKNIIDSINQEKELVVTSLREGLESRIIKSGIDLLHGECQIISKNLLMINQELLAFDYLIIATGSKPIIPRIKGIENVGVFTSKEILKNFDKEIRSITIIGGGVIGMEFATIYNFLGIRVNIIEAKNKLLPDFDKEIGQNIKMIMKKRGVNIHTSSTVNEISRFDNELECAFSIKEKTSTIKSEAILISVGRRANLDLLNKSEIKVNVENGHIKVNKKQETNFSNIYAVGDVANEIKLAHVASATGRNAIMDILNKTCKVDMNVIPSCVYTNPEIASVGISEAYAKEKGIDVNISKYPMSANGKSVLEGMDRGFIKILSSRENGKVLGGQIMCGKATEMISEISLAIRLGATIKDLSETIHPHPTYSEGIYELAKK